MESKISLNLIKNWQRLCSDIVFTDVAALLIQNKVISVDEYQAIVHQSPETRVESLLLQLLNKGEKVLLKFGESLEKDYSWLAEKLKEGYIKEESRDETDASPIKRLDPEKDVEIKKESDEDMCIDCHNLNTVNKNHKLNNSYSSKHLHSGRKKIMKTRIKNKLKPKVHNVDAVVSSTTDILKPVQNEEVTNEVITIVRKSSLVSRSWTTIAHALGLTDRVNEIRYKVVLHGEDLSMCVVYLIKDWLEMFPKIAKLSKLIEVLRGEGYNDVADKLSDILNRPNKQVPGAV